MDGAPGAQFGRTRVLVIRDGLPEEMLERRIRALMGFDLVYDPVRRALEARARLYSKTRRGNATKVARDRVGRGPI